METIKMQAQDLGIESQIIFCGNVNNVYDYLQCLDVFLLPSLYEGLPIVAVEAQANGLPIIISTNVTREVTLSKRIQFISLEEPATKWSEAVLEYVGCERVDNKDMLRKAGYDIKETANEMRELYLS